jgi:UDP:flavonoid glycosyltransferase YjiC (YdhE family)
VAISSHGFGHLAQIAPVLNQFASDTCQTNPAIRFTLRTTLKAQQIAKRVQVPFAIDNASDDFGMLMRSAFDSDLIASLQRYRALHAHWDKQVDLVAAHLSGQAVDMVFADIPYLTLAAAQSAGIVSVAMCSLNWADILEQSVRDCPSALTDAGLTLEVFERILQTMRDAYAGATIFLQPTPSMPMSGLPNACPIGVLGDPPRQVSRQTLIQWSQAAGFRQAVDGWFVLVSMGGIPTQMQATNWPTHCLGRALIYLVPPALAIQHPHALVVGADAPDYQTLIAASDAVITKPGYGTFVEACAAGTPLLYVSRATWPESEALTGWAHENGHAQAISPAQLSSGQFESALAALFTSGRSKPVVLDGAASAAAVIKRLISNNGQPVRNQLDGG